MISIFYTIYLLLLLNKFKISLIYFYMPNCTFFFFLTTCLREAKWQGECHSTLQYSVSEETTRATSFYFPIALYNNYDSPSIRSGNKSWFILNQFTSPWINMFCASDNYLYPTPPCQSRGENNHSHVEATSAF